LAFSNVFTYRFARVLTLILQKAAITIWIKYLALRLNLLLKVGLDMSNSQNVIPRRLFLGGSSPLAAASGIPLVSMAREKPFVSFVQKGVNVSLIAGAMQNIGLTFASLNPSGISGLTFTHDLPPLFMKIS
jgi:hypothetical protein